MILAQYLIILVSIIGLIVYLWMNEDGWRAVLLSAAMTSVWVVLSGLYIYKSTNLGFFNINLFPFFAWTGGLILFKMIYEKMGDHKFWKATIFYVPMLLLLEYVFYNFFGVQLNSNYPGLFGFELLHVPWYGQFYYLIAGPLFLLLMIQFDKRANSKGYYRKIF